MSHPAAPYAPPATAPCCASGPAECLPAGSAQCRKCPRGYTQPSPEAQATWNEDRLQQECLLWLQSHHRLAHRLIYHVPNGGQRSQREGAKFQAIGVKAGVPDLCLPMPGESGLHHYNCAESCYAVHGLYIELKTPQGTVSPAQREYQALLAQQGYRVAVVRSLAEFIELLTEYLA